jgi:hypothetical protein
MNWSSVFSSHAAHAIAADFSKTTDHTVSFTVTVPFLIDKELASTSRST